VSQKRSFVRRYLGQIQTNQAVPRGVYSVGRPLLAIATLSKKQKQTLEVSLDGKGQTLKVELGQCPQCAESTTVHPKAHVKMRLSHSDPRGCSCRRYSKRSPARAQHCGGMSNSDLKTSQLYSLHSTLCTCVQGCSPPAVCSPVDALCRRRLRGPAQYR
jgi:hypothetical protein